MTAGANRDQNGTSDDEHRRDEADSDAGHERERKRVSQDPPIDDELWYA